MAIASVIEETRQEEQTLILPATVNKGNLRNNLIILNYARSNLYECNVRAF